MRKILLAILLLLPLACTAVPRSFSPGDIVPDSYLAGHGADSFFSSSPIPDGIFAAMQGKSYKADCPVPREDLRYITVLHRDIEGRAIVGEMVVSALISADLLEIFRALYEASYPIERMRLVDLYDADDETSMRANNSSCFNFRFITGSTKVSKHGLGLAVDINTLYNPYHKVRPDGSDHVEPATAVPYLDRTADFPYKIVKGDLCYRLFIEHGFTWGGEWTSLKDYQHFEK